MIFKNILLFGYDGAFHTRLLSHNYSRELFEYMLEAEYAPRYIAPALFTENVLSLLEKL
jgi:hypothetical protein